MISMNSFQSNPFLFIAIFLALFISCSKQGQKKDNAAFRKGVDKITFEIVLNVDKTYGYTIRDEEEIIISQKTIPGVAGASGFSKKQNAETVALLVIHKIRNGVFPPTVTGQELESLNVHPTTMDSN